MALADVLSAATVRPVFVAWFDIKDDPIRGWTGPGIFAPTGTGDADLDGETFIEAEGLVQSSEIHEDQGIGSELTISFAISEDIEGWTMGESEVGVDALGTPGGPVYDQLVLDRRIFLGRRAKIWLFFLSADESSVLPEYDVLMNGVMIAAGMTRKDGEPAMVTLTIHQDVQKRRVAPARIVDHARFNSGDTATAYVSSLARGSTAGARPGVQPWDAWDSWNNIYDYIGR